MTGVSLHIRADQISTMDRYMVRFDDEAALVDPVPFVELVLPDRVAGSETTIEVWALNGGQQVGFGSVRVVPRKHVLLHAEVTLASTTCGTWCERGSTICMDGGTTTCQVEANGCAAWSVVTPCPEDEPTCSNGVCAETCTDECQPDAAICSGDLARRGCGQHDADACLDWSPPMACTNGQTCEAGICGGATCEPAACTMPDPPTCVGLGTLRTFGAQGTCAAGACSYPYTDSPCPNGCTAGACVPQCQPASCTTPPATTCASATTRRTYASTGTCTGGQCSYASTDTPCADPPPPTCIGATTRRTYAASGTCAGGLCTYAPTDTTCPGGCSAGACVTVPDPLLTLGYFHSCDLGSDRLLSCWGSNVAGESSGGVGQFIHADASDFFTCGIRTTGAVECWGDFAAPEPAGTFTLVSAGSEHACAIRTNGTVACWGQNNNGRATPPSGTFKALALGTDHSCGIRSDNTVACWGWSGPGSTPPTGSFVEISSGFLFSCGVRSSGALVCWGENVPPSVPTGTFLGVAASDNLACALRSTGTLACWGNDDEGAASPPSGTFTEVSVGLRHGCGRRTSGAIDCWGDNAFGQAVDQP